MKQARMHRRGMKHKRNLDLDQTLMQRNGEANGRSVLISSMVIDIYQDKRTHAVIAEAYGIARSTVSGIKSGDKWGWLTYELSHTFM